MSNIFTVGSGSRDQRGGRCKGGFGEGFARGGEYVGMFGSYQRGHLIRSVRLFVKPYRNKLYIGSQTTCGDCTCRAINLNGRYNLNELVFSNGSQLTPKGCKRRKASWTEKEKPISESLVTKICNPEALALWHISRCLPDIPSFLRLSAGGACYQVLLRGGPCSHFGARVALNED